jgi:cytochrome c oxidase subunit 2
MSLRFVVGCYLGAVVRMSAQAVYSDANIFKPTSTPAKSAHDLAILVLAVCAVIFVVVSSLLFYTVYKFRHRKTDDGHEPAQVYGSNQIEIAWTVIPILIVVVLTMATARVVAKVQDTPQPKDAIEITVIGHQWWWEVRYPKLGVITANELHMPVSANLSQFPSFLTLLSADVAHSFWVPRLAGKTDLIPGHPNRMWIDPHEPGTYLGNCAEYCGTQHANMLLRVVVESKEDFDKWVEAQKAPAAVVAEANEGRAMFLSLSCVNCHRVAGTTANGEFGPDLTHLMSRQTLAAGVIPNDLAGLKGWIHDPEEIKPGNYMPNMQLNAKELDLVVAYLSTLK